MIAPHYAEPLERPVAAAASLRDAPSASAEPLLELGPGELFLVLDDSRGWAWGYAGAERRVGYVDSHSLGRSAKH